MSDSHFIDAWTRLSAALGCDQEAAASVGRELLERHREPQRHYHTVEHINAVLRHLATLEAATPATELAAFFHDAIYDPTAADNEEQSALLAAQQLTELGIATHLIEHTTAIIRATAGHLLPTDPLPGMASFLDADLSILGATSDVYKAYADAIRREYSHMAVDDFRRGREQVLVHFAERDELYFTDAGRELWDTSARENLRTELANLRQR